MLCLPLWPLMRARHDRLMVGSRMKKGGLMHRAIHAAAIAAAFAGSAAQAAIINFDELTASPRVEGAPPAGTVLTDGYADLGVIFGRAGVSAGVSVVSLVREHVSRRNAVCGLDAAGLVPVACAADIHFYFTLPLGGGPGGGAAGDSAVSRALSFKLGDSGGDIDRFAVHSYDLAGVLLATRAVETLAFTRVDLMLVNGIHRVHIENLTGTTNGFLVDDLNFERPTDIIPPPPPPPVPAPPMLALFGLGLAALAGARHRGL